MKFKFNANKFWFVKSHKKYQMFVWSTKLSCKSYSILVLILIFFHLLYVWFYLTLKCIERALRLGIVLLKCRTCNTVSFDFFHEKLYFSYSEIKPIRRWLFQVYSHIFQLSSFKFVELIQKNKYKKIKLLTNSVPIICQFYASVSKCGFYIKL